MNEFRFFKLTKLIVPFRFARYGFYLVLVGCLVTFLIIDTANERYRLVSFFGLFVFLLLGWIFSKYPSKVITNSFTIELIFINFA